MDYIEFNRRWLNAWSERDISSLVHTYYHPNIAYRDPLVPDGLHGSEELEKHLVAVFSGPTTLFAPKVVWPHESGYFGVWIGTREGEAPLRGLDYCEMKDGKIIHNDLYVHQLKELPTESDY
ncbi:nuclear transport factor 2 family protein [uncultured Jatrophihabitans sp.]|uniref:nuclear transport factor 2 family protein n=1 Tax=uncultured Jatrophihabitans sp. TaxID=1610747 RepID=UPI0035CBE859